MNYLYVGYMVGLQRLNFGEIDFGNACLSVASSNAEGRLLLFQFHGLLREQTTNNL